jgi:GNAT superfamily N-acetyltransferase
MSHASDDADPARAPAAAPQARAPTIRDADADDVALMAGWAQAMALETEHKQLDAATVTRGLALGVADPARSRYWIAELDGQPAGTLMVTFEWSDWRCGWWWWIQSVYVAPGQRRRGVYRALYAHVLALAKAEGGVCGLRLYVERDNANALRTYEALGMRDSGYRLLEVDL